MEVKVEVKEALVHVTVKDNGTGMTAERLAEVKRSIAAAEESQRTRIGLRNVHQRLVLSYGEEHGLHIASTPGSGTEIAFTIPS